MSRAKVGLLGNMNNNHFSLARYLRERGGDAEVLLFDDDPVHFHPACDAYDLGFRDFTQQLPWGGLRQYHRTSRAEVESVLSRYDVLIGCGAAPAYAGKAKRKLDVFIPYGGDIWALVGQRAGSILDFAKNATIALPQRRGIRAARVVHMTPTNELYERQLEKIRGAAPRWPEGLPMVHDVTYDPARLPALASRTHWAHEFAQIRATSDIMLFSSTRHFWKCEPSHPAAKGTHKLLHAVATFHRRHPDVRIVLATLEYGRDVDASKALVRELGIEDCVRWLPTMYRKDLMAGLAMCDIACAEFENSWIASGVLYEALVLNKPILAYRDDALYPGMSLYPILNAKSSDEIAAALEAYWKDHDAARAEAAGGRAWYRSQVVEPALRRYDPFLAGR